MKSNNIPTSETAENNSKNVLQYLQKVKSLYPDLYEGELIQLVNHIPQHSVEIYLVNNIHFCYFHFLSFYRLLKNVLSE